MQGHTYRKYDQHDSSNDIQTYQVEAKTVDYCRKCGRDTGHRIVNESGKEKSKCTHCGNIAKF